MLEDIGVDCLPLRSSAELAMILTLTASGRGNASMAAFANGDERDRMAGGRAVGLGIAEHILRAQNRSPAQTKSRKPQIQMA